MKSPFPGMDPYLEEHWGDVHTSLVTYARDQLQRQLPADLAVRVEEHISVQDVDDDDLRQSYVPDVRIVENQASGHDADTASPSVTIAEPILVPRILEPETQRSLQIVDTRSGNRIVTTIEFLSAANKCDSRGRTAYRRKREDLEQAGVNVVEIDLLREGPYVLAAPYEAIPVSHRGPYRVVVSRATRPDVAAVYRVSLRERLPIIRIPLRSTDDDVLLDPQALIDAAYENGRYGGIDYRLDSVPPLQGDDADWAAALLRNSGRR